MDKLGAFLEALSRLLSSYLSSILRELKVNLWDYIRSDSSTPKTGKGHPLPTLLLSRLRLMLRVYNNSQLSFHLPRTGKLGMPGQRCGLEAKGELQQVG